jgi:hypothetical protein
MALPGAASSGFFGLYMQLISDRMEEEGLKKENFEGMFDRRVSEVNSRKLRDSRETAAELTNLSRNPKSSEEVVHRLRYLQRRRRFHRSRHYLRFRRSLHSHRFHRFRCHYRRCLGRLRCRRNRCRRCHRRHQLRCHHRNHLRMRRSRYS